MFDNLYERKYLRMILWKKHMDGVDVLKITIYQILSPLNDDAYLSSLLAAKL